MSTPTNNSSSSSMLPPSGRPRGVSNAAVMSKEVVIIVDPYSTGCIVAQEIMKRGYLVMCLWTDGFSEEMKTHVPTAAAGITYFKEVTEIANDLAATKAMCIAAAAPHALVACLAGGEAGVDCADALSEALGLLTNGTDIPNRRDKKIQQELCQAAGLRSVRQAGGTTFAEVEEFLRTEEFPVVLKPTESAGSDGVKLCRTFEEAKEHFHLLMESQMVNGGGCPAVLCQEFLRGKEYVVDHVSLNGVHKTAMVFVYDKRPANGSQFVYFGQIPVDPSTPESKLVIPYIRAVLDAIGVRNGPSHGEVIMTKDGPCLVEMNCRAHGGDGNWRSLCRALTGGYSQIEATVDAYLEPNKFLSLPDKPPSPFKAAGEEVIFVSYAQGKVTSMPGFEVLKSLPSFVYLETGVKVGSEVVYTIDLVTCIGSVILVHPDPAVVQRDVDFIRYLEKNNGFFTYETKAENLSRSRNLSFGVSKEDGPQLFRMMSNDRPELMGDGFSMGLKRGMTTIDASKEVVVLVDPYSTGCCIAQEVKKRGYTIMALWTRGFSEDMKTHVPLSCEGLYYTAEITEGADLPATAAALTQAAGSLRIVSIFAGGEAGVDLADALSDHFKLRTNGTDIPNRRDKKIQQELIKAAGFRSVRQAGGASFDQVEPFLRKESFPVVLKPNESAGSDGVKLCHSMDEAKTHFNILMKSQMVNGGSCPAVLCQEFLRGKEFVVDHVSRDGVHKTVMVWVYDKRPANNAQFVYFGCVPVDSNSPEARILIPYVRGVLDALGVMNGPSHGEVMMTSEGPCLVEMNCRAHGGDGNWRSLCLALNGGYSQVEAAVDAYLDRQSFLQIPDKPPSPFKAAGQEVILVSYSRGVVKATPGYDIICKLPSFVYLESSIKVGSTVDYTVDLLTGIGSVILMHHDKTTLEQDVETIRQLEETNTLFVYEEEFNLLKSFSKVNLADEDMSTEDDTPTALVPTTNHAPTPRLRSHKRVISTDRADLY